MAGRSDVIVVGGGISGLTSAYRLRQSGLSVRVLEAAGRVGGRTKSGRSETGVMIDGGGQWIGPGQDRVAALAKELGAETFLTHHKGRGIMHMNGRRRTHPHELQVAFPGIGLDFAQAAVRLQLLAWRVDRDRPWTARRAAELDEQTLHDWLQHNVRTQGARDLFEILAGMTLGGDPRELSVLAAVHHMRAAGSLLRLMSIDYGAQKLRFVDGAQTLSLRIADELGDAVTLNAPVERIEQTDRAVTVRSGAGEFEADRAIVAMSPPDRSKIDFAPALPAAETQIGEQTSAFKAIKIHLVYPRPFWRDDGLSGHAVSDRGPAPLCFDNSPPDASAGVLATFVAAGEFESRLAPTPEQLNDPDVRRAAVIQCMVDFFGAEAAEPLEYIEQDWRDEPYLAGCIPTVPPGVLTRLAPNAGVRHGNVFWAGTEQAHIWNGYIDGAVRAGEDAAAGIAAELSPAAAAA